MPCKNNTSSGRGLNGFGSIRQKTVTKKDGREYTYWEARCTVGIDTKTGKQVQKSITGKTKKEVSQKLKELSREVDSGAYTEPTKMTLSEWLATWESDYLGAVKESTAYLYKRDMTLYIIPSLGAVKLTALKTQMIQQCFNELLNPSDSDKKPLSPKTVKDVHGAFHKALQQALELGYIHSNPSDACKLPRVIRKDIEPLDETQLACFLSAIDGHVHENLYKITVFTGLREGEVLGLTWDCIDLEKGTAKVNKQLRRRQEKGGEYYFSPPKNNKSRTLTLAPTVVQTFKREKQNQLEMQSKAGEAWNNEHDLVFTNELGGFLSYRTAYDCFKRVVASIGCPNARFHDLRHTYAVAAIQSGDDIKTVQENLGHATAAFTLDVYGHVTDNMRRESANRMENFIKSLSAQK